MLTTTIFVLIQVSLGMPHVSKSTRSPFNVRVSERGVSNDCSNLGIIFHLLRLVRGVCMEFASVAKTLFYMEEVKAEK